MGIGPGGPVPKKDLIPEALANECYRQDLSDMRK